MNISDIFHVIYIDIQFYHYVLNELPGFGYKVRICIYLLHTRIVCSWVGPGAREEMDKMKSLRNRLLRGLS